MVATYLFNFIIISAFFILLVGTVVAYIIYACFYKNQVLNIIKNDTAYNIVKNILLYSLLLSFLVFFSLFVWFYKTVVLSIGYVVFNTNTNTITNSNFLNQVFSIEFSTDLFGNILLFLAYFVGLLSIVVLDNRVFWKNIRHLFAINMFVIIVYLYVSATNIVLFFLFYEFLLLPSFLIVYFISPSRRAIQASLYFLIWTQIGSFLVLLTICYMIVIVGSADFLEIKAYNFNYETAMYIYIGLFLGFGFKVPVWPFHYWLTKTHVEAPSGFSMYLSGFLVKSAVYGFYKISSLLGNDINTTIFVSLCLVGVCDASFKMWGQTDLKRLVAYGTIQEMNLIYLTFMWGDTNAIIGGLLFCITHGALSSLMFFLVDCIYRRFASRSVVELSGIIHSNPVLGTTIIVMCVLYSGLPGTIKFTCEFYIFSGIFEISLLLCCCIFVIANVFGLVGFFKCWFDSIFGLSTKNVKTTPFDLSLKELYVLYAPITLLIVLVFIPNVLL